MAGVFALVKSQLSRRTSESRTSSSASNSFAAAISAITRNLSFRQSESTHTKHSLDDCPTLESKVAGLTFDAMSTEGESLRNEDLTARSKAKLTIQPECMICCSEVKPYQWSKPCRICQQVMCHGCLTIRFSIAQTNAENMPVRCCGALYHPAVFRTVVSPDNLVQYMARLDEKQTPNPLYCAENHCSVFIPPRLQEPIDGKIQCNECNTITCITCRQVAQKGHTCVDNSEHKKITEQLKYKKCPKCGTGIQKMHGCNHVQCPCGGHWCWSCQRPQRACERHPCPGIMEDEAPDPEDDINSEEEEGALERDNTSQPDNNDNGQDTIMSLVSNVDGNTILPPNDGNGSDAAASNGLEASATSTSDIAAPPTYTPTVTTPSDGPETPTSMYDADYGPDVQENVSEDVERNLDDPRNQNWEETNLDFGEEPGDDTDVWGCSHSYHKMTRKRLHDNWLVNVKASEGADIECLSCFAMVNIGDNEPASPPGPAKQKSKRNVSLTRQDATLSDPVNEMDAAPACSPIVFLQDLPQDMTPEEREVAEYEARVARGVEEDRVRRQQWEDQEQENSMADVNSVFECSLCGVFHCFGCWQKSKEFLKKWNMDGMPPSPS